MIALAIALDSIWRHRLRSVLTALGVVIGVFAVVTLTSLGASVRSMCRGNLLRWAPPSSRSRQRWPTPAAAATRTRALAVCRGWPPARSRWKMPMPLPARRVSAVADIPVTVGTAPSAASRVPLARRQASYFQMEQIPFLHGRFSGSGLVLGYAAAHTLFPQVANAMGRTVYVGRDGYPVEGLLKKGSGIAALEPNREVFVPVAAGLKLAGLSTVVSVVVQASSTQTVGAAAATVTHVMTARHPSKNFSVTEESQLVSTVSTITTFLAGLAAISLLVADIGIVNIMLVTVTERFRVIGIRKAMGVRSVLLALLGEAVGVAPSAVASGIVAGLGRVPGRPFGKFRGAGSGVSHDGGRRVWRAAGHARRTADARGRPAHRVAAGDGVGCIGRCTPTCRLARQRGGSGGRLVGALEASRASPAGLPALRRLA